MLAPRVAAACAAAALGACGTSADEEAVRATIDKLERALRKGDGPGVCALYSEGRPFCRAHFGRAEVRSVGFAGEVEVRDVHVDGDRATARVENVRGARRVAGSARLRKVGGRWLLVPPGGG